MVLCIAPVPPAVATASRYPSGLLSANVRFFTASRYAGRPMIGA